MPLNVGSIQSARITGIRLLVLGRHHLLLHACRFAHSVADVTSVIKNDGPTTAGLGSLSGVLVNPGLVVGFLLLSALLSMIPGPSVLLETSRAITQGRRPAMWIVLGNALGGMALLALVLTGLGAIVATSATLFLVVKIAGACYLLWLGVQSLLSARGTGSELEASPAAGSSATGVMAVRQGFTVGVSNPKSIVSLMAVLPQFVDHQLGDPTLQMLIIGIIGGVTQVVIETLWVFAAGALREWFRRRPRRIQNLKAAGGIAMIGLAGKLAVGR